MTGFASRNWFRLAGVCLLCTNCAAFPSTKATDPNSPLQLVETIDLPDTHGRIDHLALDQAGHRLFVGEIANGTVDVVDLRSGKVTGRISGLAEPQGVEWLPAQGEIVVACGGGNVRFFAGSDLHPVADVPLGEDADDVRIDQRNGQVVVGYGDGGLAAIDPATHTVVRRATFDGHPEGFQLSGGRAYVNVPDDGAILAVDLDKGQVLSRWKTGLKRLNFPMALAPDGKSITVAFRLPATWARIDTATGTTLATHATCGDSDDAYLDGPRLLLVCGAGHVDVVNRDKLEARVKTAGGARTGVYAPALHRLYVAVPDRNGPAAIWVLDLKRTG